MEQIEALLHDGTAITVSVEGSGSNVVLPARTEPHDQATAESMRQWGAEPDLGPTLIRALSRTFRVIAADYEGHRMAHPAPDTLTPDNVSADLLAIADAAGAGRFAYYGYSWLALCGLQLAIRTDRLWALVMGGYPPIEGPYAAMLAVTRAAHAMAVASASTTGPSGTGAERGGDAAVTPGDWDAVSVQTDEAQTKQFVTLYEALREFDDVGVQSALTMPRLCFAGSDDAIDYGPRWGDTRVRIAEPLAARRAELEAAGWDVELLPGLDHMTAMHSRVVLPILTDWLARADEAKG